jgi:phytoene dehydrogenase-like protein
MIASHYFRGGWYPVGGSGRIAETVQPVVKAAGGDLRVNHEVREILIENGRAVGVKVSSPKAGSKAAGDLVFRAPVIVSNAGAVLTFRDLVPDTYPLQFRQQVEFAPRGFTVVTLYLGLKESPAKLGFRGENHWIFDSFDMNEMSARRNELVEGNPHMVYLSFPSLKDPEPKPHTAEIIAPLDYGVLEQFADTKWKKRGPEYDEIKERISQSLLEFVEERYPGFGEMVEYRELATPLTVEHFLGSPRGSIYGYPGVPERYEKQWLTPKTGIKNLWLTGTDVASHGIVGAMMGGVATAGKLLGPFGFFRVMSAAYRETAIRKNQQGEPARADA